MAQEGLLLTGAIAAIAGIGVLRLSWGRDHRSATLNTAGWALLGGGTVAGWLAAGAWGATVVSLWAMGAALVCLAVAAWISPPARRAASKRRAGVLPEGDEPLGLGRRAASSLRVPANGWTTFSETPSNRGERGAKWSKFGTLFKGLYLFIVAFNRQYSVYK